VSIPQANDHSNFLGKSLQTCHYLLTMASITLRRVEFDELIAQYEDLKVFKPLLRHDWHYLGPVAVTPGSPNKHGFIVKANVPDVLDEVVDWKPVFKDIEGRQFSTWRGVPSNPEKFVVIGHFFVTGVEKPTPEQTAGIKAIRRDLVEEVEPHHLIFKKILPKAILTLWNVFATVTILIPTGAFVSSPGGSAESRLGLIRVSAVVETVE